MKTNWNQNHYTSHKSNPTATLSKRTKRPELFSLDENHLALMPLIIH